MILRNSKKIIKEEKDKRKDEWKAKIILRNAVIWKYLFANYFIYSNFILFYKLSNMS